MEITARADAKLFCTQRPSSSVESCCRSSCLLLSLPPVHTLLPLLHPSYLHLLGGKAWISPFPLSLALKRSLSPSHLAPLLSFPPLPCQTILCFYSKSFLPEPTTTPTPRAYLLWWTSPSSQHYTVYWILHSELCWFLSDQNLFRISHPGPVHIFHVPVTCSYDTDINAITFPLSLLP